MKYLIILIFLFSFKFSVAQVNSVDSATVFNLWNMWNSTYFQNYYSLYPFVYSSSTYVSAGGACWLYGRVWALSANNIIQTGNLPFYIANLSELKQLDLRNNPNLGGIIPPEIGNLTKLEMLLLDNCNFNSIIPSEIGNLSSLTDLYLGSPGLTGTIPNTFGNLNNLFVFSLWKSNVTGPLPGCFGLIDSLAQISMYLNTNFVSTIPDSICMATNLRSLEISRNAFYGTIPACLGSQPLLGVVDISHNNFSGAIPSSLFPPYSHVTTFYADSNQFTSLPFIPIVLSCPLTILDISHNKLQFGDFESTYLTGYRAGIGNVSPQDSVWSVLDTTVFLNNYVTLNSTVTGNFNTYNWFKNGTAIGSSTNGLWQIPNVQYVDSGTYTCDVTNLYVTPWKGLILNRKPIYLHVANGSGIIEQTNNTSILEVYPNPCTNNITVNLKQIGLEPVNITVLDANGKIVLQAQTTEYENSFNTEKLAKGLYLVKVESGNNISLTKFTKE